jgi:hypothetical protein
MITHLAAAQARHAQALSALADAESEVLAAMRAIEPSFAGNVTNMLDRRWEARLEGKRPLWELSRAYSAFRRAHRAEAKARSAAYRDTLVAVPAAPPAPPAPRRKKATRRKMTIASYLAEARAA